MTARRPKAAWMPMQKLFCRFCKDLLIAPTMLYTGVRHFNVPDLRKRDGGLLIASNHQSFLDPILVGLPLGQPIHYLARRSLFGVPGFGQLLVALNTHPVSIGEVDADALKTTIRLLRGGEALLMFPEGTRTRDGELGEFKPGVAAIAIRCGVPILPACVEGAYECWPRTQMLPHPSWVAVAYGELLRPRGESAEELTVELRRRVAELRAFLRGYLGRSP